MILKSVWKLFKKSEQNFLFDCCVLKIFKYIHYWSIFVFLGLTNFENRRKNTQKKGKARNEDLNFA